MNHTRLCRDVRASTRADSNVMFDVRASTQADSCFWGVDLRWASRVPENLDSGCLAPWTLSATIIWTNISQTEMLRVELPGDLQIWLWKLSVILSDSFLYFIVYYIRSASDYAGWILPLENQILTESNPYACRILVWKNAVWAMSPSRISLRRFCVYCLLLVCCLCLLFVFSAKILQCVKFIGGPEGTPLLQIKVWLELGPKCIRPW